MSPRNFPATVFSDGEDDYCLVHDTESRRVILSKLEDLNYEEQAELFAKLCEGRKDRYEGLTTEEANA